MIEDLATVVGSYGKSDLLYRAVETDSRQKPGERRGRLESCLDNFSKVSVSGGGRIPYL